MLIFYLPLISSTSISSCVICWICFHQRNTFYWQLAMSVVPPLLSCSQFFVRYIPSAKECPLLLQLPDGQISKTNSFISPVSYHAIIIIFLSYFLRLLKLKFLMWLNFCWLAYYRCGEALLCWTPKHAGRIQKVSILLGIHFCMRLDAFP